MNTLLLYCYHPGQRSIRSRPPVAVGPKVSFKAPQSVDFDTSYLPMQENSGSLDSKNTVSYGTHGIPIIRDLWRIKAGQRYSNYHIT